MTRLHTRTGTPAAAAAAAVTAAWQRVLQSEHAAIFGYGIVGPYLVDAVQIGHARTLEQAHREQRDALMSQLAAGGVTPTPPNPFYPPDRRITNEASAQRWAYLLERACAAAYRSVLIASVPLGTTAVAEPVDTAARGQALTGLSTSALAAAIWGEFVDPAAPTVAFPGM